MKSNIECLIKVCKVYKLITELNCAIYLPRESQIAWSFYPANAGLCCRHIGALGRAEY